MVHCILCPAAPRRSFPITTSALDPLLPPPPSTWTVVWQFRLVGHPTPHCHAEPILPCPFYLDFGLKHLPANSTHRIKLHFSPFWTLQRHCYVLQQSDYNLYYNRRRRCPLGLVHLLTDYTEVVTEALRLACAEIDTTPVNSLVVALHILYL